MMFIVVVPALGLVVMTPSHVEAGLGRRGVSLVSKKNVNEKR
jgi:hypothetical protein